MKTIVKLSLAAICLASITGFTYAAKPGAYVGAGIGASMIDKQKDTKGNQNNGLAGRLFAGYNFNEYFGLEAGLAKYGKASSKTITRLSEAGNPANFVDFNNTIRTDLAAFDIVGKAYLPIQDTGFNLYALGGVAYVNQVKEFRTTAVASTGEVATAKANHKQNSAHPIYGVGASYNVPQSNVVTNLEFTRLQGSTALFSGKKSTNANMITFNVAYNFD